MDNLIFADNGFEPSEINPYTGRPYSEDWVYIELVETANYYLFNGGNAFVFKVSISKNCPDWQFRLLDFIEYEQEEGKRIIIKITEDDFSEAKKAYAGHCHTDNFLRKSEGKYFVHSTTAENYKNIVKDGCLKSWNILKAEGKIKEKKPIGVLLGDHSNYSDYIMLSDGGVAGEIVVNSKNCSKIVMDTNAPYSPGARLYFDAEKIAENGILIRDGVHYKVKNILPLKDFLLWTATPESIGFLGKRITPRQFADLSDNIFNKQFN